MSARHEHLDGLLCHCDVDPAGHPLGTEGCASAVKAGRWTRPDWRALVESGLTPDARTALVELRRRAYCIGATDTGRPCPNRATLFPDMYCGVHG